MRLPPPFSSLSQALFPLLWGSTVLLAQSCATEVEPTELNPQPELPSVDEAGNPPAMTTPTATATGPAATAVPSGGGDPSTPGATDPGPMTEGPQPATVTPPSATDTAVPGTAPEDPDAGLTSDGGE